MHGCTKPLNALPAITHTGERTTTANKRESVLRAVWTDPAKEAELKDVLTGWRQGRAPSGGDASHPQTQAAAAFAMTE
jgi:hypothetical protein